MKFLSENLLSEFFTSWKDPLLSTEFEHVNLGYLGEHVTPKLLRTKELRKWPSHTNENKSNYNRLCKATKSNCAHQKFKCKVVHKYVYLGSLFNDTNEIREQIGKSCLLQITGCETLQIKVSCLRYLFLNNEVHGIRTSCHWINCITYSISQQSFEGSWPPSNEGFFV